MSGTPIDPSSQFVAVTPSDTAILKYQGPNDTVAQPARTKGIYVGGSGNLAVKNDNDSSVTLIGVLAGVVYPISTQQIMATNTTATNIVGLF